MASVPEWVWLLVSTNLLATITTVAAVKVEVRHLTDGVREAKESARRAHQRIDHCNKGVTHA